ncbi:hypothetical protein K6799_004561 [Vibrio parahaemolyticus]|uniref:hypothetical protein n=1 Tax=Vibrio rotiferianus TaxID=190895 RepID=UPI002895267E|nr:hypothetical protein [Vibrio parahaemolyticus]EIA1557827.1 hypothetical protein [Vibrio parahaemolyticus]CAH1588953.1 hypothetical protein THOG10_480009 [Vibrio rotiferianus]CAH1592096.1 hypothetical protein THOB06_500008 [Vibrio rotiferianus]
MSKKNTADFHVLKDGKMIHGNAAFLHLASKAGGVDGFLEKYGNEIVKNTLTQVVSDVRSKTTPPPLKSVS